MGVRFVNEAKSLNRWFDVTLSGSVERRAPRSRFFLCITKRTRAEQEALNAQRS